MLCVLYCTLEFLGCYKRLVFFEDTVFDWGLFIFSCHDSIKRNKGLRILVFSIYLARRPLIISIFQHL